MRASAGCGPRSMRVVWCLPTGTSHETGFGYASLSSPRASVHAATNTDPVAG
jgi:hypothetical protein